MLISIYGGRDFEKTMITVNGEDIPYELIGRYNKMIPLTKYHIGETVKIEIETELDEFAIYQDFLYYEKEEVFRQHYDELSKDQVALTEISGREYEGTIELASGKEYVLFSIPYDKGWTITVDDKKQEIINLQDGFMGVKVRRRKSYDSSNICTRRFYLWSRTYYIWNFTIWYLCYAI